MSDLWSFSSSSPPIIHHSSVPESPAFISSLPPLSSPSSFSHGNHPHKVTSPHLPEAQVASPHLPSPQLTSPHHLHSQITFNHFTEPPVTSPHLPEPQITLSHLPSPQLTSPHHLHSQVTFNHFPEPQVTSPHLPHPEGTSPYVAHQTHHLLHQPQITSPHYVLQSQVTSPHHPPHAQVTSPHAHQQVTSPHPHSQVMSPHHLPHPQVTSPHAHQQVTSPHPHSQVMSPHHLPHPQVTSPHPHSQVMSPHHLPHPQVTSPHAHPQVTSPHPHSQVMSPHHLPHPQVTSPHPHSQVMSPHDLPHPQVTSPHAHPQVTSPHILPHHINSPYLSHPHVSSPHLVPQTELTSPQVTQAHISLSHFLPQVQVTSPHLVSLPQNHLSNQNHNPGLDDSDWCRSELSTEISCLLNSCSFQIQTTAPLELHLQNQNQFRTGVTHHRDELENTQALSYNNHTLITSGMYVQGDTSAPGQEDWEPLDPTLSQLQCSPLDSMSGDVTLGRWSSVECSSSSHEDFSSTQFFPDSYHNNNAPQSFCSPTTTSPHYPKTPTISSPSPQVQPKKERLGFPTQTLTQKINKGRNSCLHEPSSYNLTSDPSQQHPHKTSRNILPSQAEPGLLNASSNSKNCFSPHEGGQDVSSAAQSPDVPAGLKWREECGGGGRRRGGGRERRGGKGRGGDAQPDWTWVKQPQDDNSAEILSCRLLCMVCKRDFRSLPALNGHMRSHSGFRTSTGLKKGEDPSVSMVMPVSVPVQSRGVSKACRSGQRVSGRVPPATRDAVLYRSLMHLGEEQEVFKGNGVVDKDGGSGDGANGHYTPPPMLCPLRVGPGLYCSLTTTRQQQVQTVQLHNMETLTKGINKPQINEGQGFQAEIPPLLDHKHAQSDSHNALLLWTPLEELEHPANQKRVEALMTMAHSSVMPGGVASPEYTLNVLSQSRGDFLLAVEKLLSTPEVANHTGWSAAERRLLVKSLQHHQKDFSSIQRAVQTKSLAQCVEFYYLWKRKLNLTVNVQAGLTITLPNTSGQRSTRSNNAP
ncbi:uncharacterized protein LOC113127149 isoform X2 [Mastacembelus armatus]|uniref:uncharacterized protein LOC113127149 isoform X2 n=1 Tax=Mastacembelus armatus TaxID=205130 RepID=UPI000E45942B|nr:uncharacterized protein LOC113127149 isoform X2 [Mastacembelus armatus]